MKTIIVAACALLPGVAQAHTGHGVPGIHHWHATDTLGLLTVLAAAAVACWLSKRK